MKTVTGSQTFLWEFFGIATLILLGNGVCTAINLRTARAANAGWLSIAFKWGLAVPAGALIADVSDGHLNPAVTVALAFDDTMEWNLIPYYVTGQLLGTFVGAILAWVVLRQLFDANGVDDNGNPININAETDDNFFTMSPHPNNFRNAVTELLATFVLFSFILFGPTGGELDPLKYFGVLSIIVSIDLSLDSPTGYAVNPIRGLDPRLAYAFILPTKGKGDANWPYARVPIVAPMLAAIATDALTPAI